MVGSKWTRVINGYGSEKQKGNEPACRQWCYGSETHVSVHSTDGAMVQRQTWNEERRCPHWHYGWETESERAYVSSTGLWLTDRKAISAINGAMAQRQGELNGLGRTATPPCSSACGEFVAHRSEPHWGIRRGKHLLSEVRQRTLLSPAIDSVCIGRSNRRRH